MVAVVVVLDAGVRGMIVVVVVCDDCGGGSVGVMVVV